MRLARLWHLAFPGLVAISCAASAPPAAKPATAEAGKPVVLAAVPPPPAVPQAGDPGDVELGEARLTETTCEDNGAEERRIADERVATMRREVDAAYADWLEDSRYPCVRYPRPVARRSAGEALGGGGFGRAGSPSQAAPPTRLSATPTEKKSKHDSSSTNTQVTGVDEADLVKTDGDYLYLAAGHSLRIVRTDSPRTVSVTKLQGEVRELFLVDNRVVAYVSDGSSGQRACTYGYDCQVMGDGSRTDVVVLDVADRAAPRVLRTIGLSGSLIAARRIGNAVHTVVSDHDQPEQFTQTAPNNVPWCGVGAGGRGKWRAAFEQLKKDNETRIRNASATYPTLTENGVKKSLCNTLKTPLADGKAFTTLMSFDLDGASAPVTTTLRSRPGTVFASEEGLYVAVRHQRQGRGMYRFFEQENEVSDLHKFHIGPRAEVTRYRGSGVIPGHVLNQFAMDERGGVLRVATTKGRVPDPRVESVLSMLVESKQGNMIRVSAIEHIAPGEDIRSVRFDDDRGYVVTFKKTDPLFVLDLADARAPKILGELKIPGFSTYMHRIDRDHLLSIGFDADDHGDFAYFNGLLLQIFDVKNPTEPRLLHRATLGSRGSSSEAATNHLAFTYMPERNLLAIPATVCDGGGDGRFGSLTFSGLVLFDTSVEGGFRKLGGVNHGTAGANCSTWWSQANSQVKRSVIVDDQVFSIAGDHMKVQNLKRLGTDLAMLSLRD